MINECIVSYIIHVRYGCDLEKAMAPGAQKTG